MQEGVLPGIMSSHFKKESHNHDDMLNSFLSLIFQWTINAPWVSNIRSRSKPDHRRLQSRPQGELQQTLFFYFSREESAISSLIRGGWLWAGTWCPLANNTASTSGCEGQYWKIHGMISLTKSKHLYFLGTKKKYKLQNDVSWRFPHIFHSTGYRVPQQVLIKCRKACRKASALVNMQTHVKARLSTHCVLQTGDCKPRMFHSKLGIFS